MGRTLTMALSKITSLQLGAAAIIAFVFISTIALALYACETGITPTDRAHGMPLDACSITEYDRPVWLPKCDHAYKVYDRQLGHAWWLLVIHEGCVNEGYVVLPLEEDYK